MPQMQHEDLTRQIIGCAYKVYNTMGFGFLESIYEECMMIELTKLGLRVLQQHRLQSPMRTWWWVRFPQTCMWKIQSWSN